MKIPEFRRISRGDLPPIGEADAPPESSGKFEWLKRWIEIITEPINQQLERLTSLAQRKISYSDNFNSSTNTIKVVNNTATKFTAEIRGQPISVQIEKVIGLFSPRRFDWRNASKPREVEVIVVWDTPLTESVGSTGGDYFANRYFPKRYFNERYWGKGGGGVPQIVDSEVDVTFRTFGR